MRNDLNSKTDTTPHLGDDDRTFFDELFDDADIARMYLASLMSQTPDLAQLAIKQRQLGLWGGYFSVGAHPKKEYYLHRLEEIAAILENDQKSLTEVGQPQEVQHDLYDADQKSNENCL